MRGDVCLWWGRSKKKGKGVRGGGEKKGKKKEMRRCGTCVVGGKKKREGGEGRIYNGNRGRGRRKMRKEGILRVVKKIK